MYPSQKLTTFLISGATLVFLLGSVGCATGGKLRVQAEEIQVLNSSIEERAYRCAPRELATSQANVDFGLYELRKGNSRGAREHLRIAEENSRIARALSQFEECELQQVAIQQRVTRRAEVTADPVNFMWDTTGDGIPDHLTECPFEPIVFIGDPEQERTGCPNFDIDNDGVPNTEDHCPSIPGNVDGFAGVNGCPMLDIDGDGVLNINDSCPDEPVEFIGFRDETGCPNIDVDRDGVPNVLDECPFEPGPASNAGCPVVDDRERLAEVVGDRIQLNQQVFFETSEATILPQSYPLLNQVAEILEDNPAIRIRIEGHTDSRGSWDYNKRLSDNRAASVRQFLVDRGIDARRMESQGYSFDRPIDDNATEEGRANNRRVEIHITSR